jgi:hypothetical protein
LQARVSELKSETEVSLCVREFGANDEHAVELGFGVKPAWRASDDKLIAESGAMLLINLARDGFVRFAFVPSEIDGDATQPVALLGSEDPAHALSKLDAYLEEFLTRAAQTHWSCVKP